MSTTITRQCFITIRGNGDAERVVPYLYSHAHLTYTGEEDGGRFVAIAAVTVSQEVTGRDTVQDVVDNLTSRLHHLATYQADRLASGGYGAKVTEEPEV